MIDEPAGVPRRVQGAAMIRQIPFAKYSCLGNHFVILDETHREWIGEQEKPRFAQSVSDPQFGIGCDNLLVIQRTTVASADKLTTQRHRSAHLFADLEYLFEGAATSDMPLFTFRMYESTGTEYASRDVWALGDSHRR